jgi:hypothetical protein
MQPLLYHLYYFDRNGNVRHCVDLHCFNDDEAVSMVAAHSDGRPMELWRGAALIRRFICDEAGLIQTSQRQH